MNRAVVVLTQTLLLVGVLAALCPRPATAGSRDHDDGFFLRASLGAAWATTTSDGPFVSYQYLGPAVSGEIAIGGIVVPKLALHATLSGWAAGSPDSDASNFAAFFTGPYVTLKPTGSVGAGFLGFGATYFAGDNIYVTGSLGVARQGNTRDFPDADSDFGPGAQFAVGIERGITDRWSLGVSAGVELYRMREQHPIRWTSIWTARSIPIRISVTFN